MGLTRNVRGSRGAGGHATPRGTVWRDDRVFLAASPVHTGILFFDPSEWPIATALLNSRVCTSAASGYPADSDAYTSDRFDFYRAFRGL